MRNAFAEDLAPRRRHGNIYTDITWRYQRDLIYTRIQEASMPLWLPWKRATSGRPEARDSRRPLRRRIYAVHGTGKA